MPCDPALAVEADVVIRGEIVPLAGHDHVVVAVGAELGRAAGLRRDQSAGGGEGGGLGFLAAERAAHPAHLDDDLGMAAPEQFGDEMLDLARMLGRAEDVELALLAGHRERGLAFEIEMLLPAHLEIGRRGGAARRRGPASASPRAMIWVASISRARGHRVRDRDQSGQRLDHRLAEPRGAAGGARAGRGDEEQRLAGIEDLAVGEAAGRHARPGRHCSRRGCRRR